MPVHDWTRVDAGIFHDFHLSWIAEIKKSLNGGLLPTGYYALAEQHAGQTIPDVLTLHASVGSPESPPPPAGGTLLAEAPPRVRRRQSIPPSALRRRRSLAIRHVSGHRLIALLEVVSPANKDRAQSIKEFAEKVESALLFGVHVLVVDLFPPRKHDPQGIHGAIQQLLNEVEEPYELLAEEPLTLASYIATPCVEAYLEHVGVGVALPNMPLFLHSDRYVDVPLETTYAEAYRSVPAFWRDVLAGHSANPANRN